MRAFYLFIYSFFLIIELPEVLFASSEKVIITSSEYLYLFIIIAAVLYAILLIVKKIQSVPASGSRSRTQQSNLLQKDEEALRMPFKLIVDDVFSIKDRGTVVTGKIESGECKTGDRIQIKMDTQILNSTLSGIEQFAKMTDNARAGDSVGLLLKDITNEQIKRGAVITKI